MADERHDEMLDLLMGEVEEVKIQVRNRDPEEDDPKKRGTTFLEAVARGELGKEKPKSKGTATKGKNAATFDLGTSKEQIVRLTSKTFLSPFDVLMMTPDAPDDLLKKRYRKISLLVHPDKNPEMNDLAQEAFQCVSKAYADIQSGETEVDLSKYNDILDEAKRRVKKEIREINKLRVARGEEPISNKDEDIAEDVIEMCEKMLSKMEERVEYAKATLGENIFREEEEERTAAEQAELEKKLLREFKAGRNNRGAYWQDFTKEGGLTRGIKRSGGFTKETVEEEDRQAHAPTQQASNLKNKRRKGAAGVDDSWKKNWR